MPTLVFSNNNPEALYFCPRAGDNICWCHPDYPVDRRGADYASEHEVSEEEYAMMAVAIRGGNLTDPDVVPEDPTTPITKAEPADPTVTKKKTTKK